MRSAPGHVSRSSAFLVASCLGALLAAQPVCDVLLRPAFHYSTDGLTVMVVDSSTTFGQIATTTISFGDGTSASTSMQHTFQEPGTYTVCMTLSTATLNCTSDYCREVTVPSNTCPSLNAHFDVLPVTTNSLTLTDMSIGATNAQRFWEFGDGTTSTEVAPMHTWLLPGPHFVSLTLTEGQCTATYGRWIEVDGNATTCFPHLFLDFTTNTEGTAGVFDPQIENNGVIPMLGIWSFGDGHVDTAVVGMNTYAAEGEYQTCLLVGALIPPDMDTCFSLICRTTYILPLVGIEEDEDASLRVWPNPFRDLVSIGTNALVQGTYVELLDGLGRRILAQPLRELGVAPLDLGHLPDGAYVLVLRSPDRQQRIRLLKLTE